MSGVDKAATESEGISNVPLRNPFFSGGRFLCWWRKAKRHRNHHKETQDFSQVMAVFHKLTVVASPLCDVCVMRLRVLLRVAAAVMTSVGGVCLTCCLLSCPRTSSAEERLLRLSCLHERPHVFTLLVSLTFFFSSSQILEEVLQCLSFTLLWSLNKSSELLTCRVSYLAWCENIVSTFFSPF